MGMDKDTLVQETHKGNVSDIVGRSLFVTAVCNSAEKLSLVLLCDMNEQADFKRLPYTLLWLYFNVRL